MSIDVPEKSEEILEEQIASEYQDEVTAEEIAEVMERFMNYGVSEEQEVVRGTLSNIADKLGVSQSELRGSDGSDSENQSADYLDVADLTEDNQWASLVVKVTQVWDNDGTEQAGVIDDGTGSVKFVSFDSSLPVLVEGETYEIRNCVTNQDEYQGEVTTSVVLNSATDIEMSDESIKASNEERTLVGAMIDTKPGSGLIERDEDGNTVGRDYEGDTTYDIRIRAVFDVGTECYTANIDNELTERLTGISVENARDIAREALDKDAVEDEMVDMLGGAYYKVTGNVRGDTIFVNEIEAIEEPTFDGRELLVRARSM